MPSTLIAMRIALPLTALLLLPHLALTQETWRRSYGGMAAETAFHIIQTDDEGFLVTGTTGSFGNGSSDIYVLKLDALGEVEWSRTYGTAGAEQGVAGKQVADGYILAGSTALGDLGGYDMTLIRTDEAGEVLWQRSYGSPDWDLCHALEVLDDGFLIGGITHGSGATEGQAFLVRTDMMGEVVWSSIASEPFGSSCNALDVAIDGRIVIAGHVGRPNGNTARFMASYASDGEPVWHIDLESDSTDAFHGVLITEDGRVVAIGTSFSYGPVSVINLHAVDLDGNELWDRTIGNEADAGGTSIVRSHDGGFTITGFNTLNQGDPDMIFTMLDNDGYWLAGDNYGNGNIAYGSDVRTTTDGGYILVGWIEGPGPGVRAVYVVKTDANGQTASKEVIPYSDPMNIDPIAGSSRAILPSILPTEATSVSIGMLGSRRTLVVLDMQGRVVHQSVIPQGVTSIGLPAMIPGHYVVTIHGSGYLVHQRVLRMPQY